MKHTIKATCIICSRELTDGVYEYSVGAYKVPMCLGCQNKFKTVMANRKNKKTSEQQVFIHLALNHRGIDNILEYCDDHKSVDIAILESKLYVEVNGLHHAYDADQLVRDMKRDAHSFDDGYLTLHVYNVALDGKFNTVVNAIRSISEKRKKQL